MVEVRREGELGASVDEVWALISDFGGFLEALGMSVEIDGEGIGQTRTIGEGDEPTVERLDECDDAKKRLVYSIVKGVLPITDYVSTMQLSPAGEGRTTLAWSSTFEPKDGTSVADAQRIIGGVYKGGITALQARFGS